MFLGHPRLMGDGLFCHGAHSRPNVTCYNSNKFTIDGQSDKFALINFPDVIILYNVMTASFRFGAVVLGLCSCVLRF